MIEVTEVIEIVLAFDKKVDFKIYDISNFSFALLTLYI